MEDKVEGSGHGELDHAQLLLPHTALQEAGCDDGGVDEQHEQIPCSHVVSSEALVQHRDPIPSVLLDAEPCRQRRRRQLHHRVCQRHGVGDDGQPIERDSPAKANGHPIHHVPEIRDVAPKLPLIAHEADLEHLLDEQDEEQPDPDALRDVIHRRERLRDRKDSDLDILLNPAVIIELEGDLQEAIKVCLRVQQQSLDVDASRSAVEPMLSAQLRGELEGEGLVIFHLEKHIEPTIVLSASINRTIV
mmetsp:Transcript_81651/g.249407  ORF Transcript_81651/g.249407 Transcript_81651/m.249407 type:complete len:247 (-) Transcript_81651:210-950(-)